MSLRNIHQTRKSAPWIYILLLFIIIGAMLALRFISKNDNVAKANAAGDSDTIRAAVVYGPGSYQVLTASDGSDSIAGVNYHLLKALQDSLGVPVELHPVIERDDALKKVASGYFDILASLPADNYLRENFLTSDEVSLDKLVLIQHRNVDGTLPVTSALALAGDSVHVEKGSAAVRRLENLSKEIGEPIIIVEEEGLSEEYLTMKVAAGTWRYAVVNEKTASNMKAVYPDLDYSTPVSFTQFQVWVLPQGHDSLLNKVNYFIAKFK